MDEVIRILTQWGRDKMAVISQTTLLNAFSWMKMLEFWLTFHWSLFLRVQLTIFQHWFRWWLGAQQATSHYLNQWWPSSTKNICVTRPQWVNSILFLNTAHNTSTKRGKCHHCNCLYITEVTENWSKSFNSRGWFNIKIQSYQDLKLHCENNVSLQLSYLNNGISFTSKMTYSYWIRALGPVSI